MAAEKLLVLVVDGTVSMAPHWDTIRTNYLEKIIRYFCREESTSQAPPKKYALGLVVYGAIQPQNVFPAKPPCTTDMRTFLQWLADLSFTDYIAVDEFGIAGGLANALEMFIPNQHVNEAQQLGERHCILVASSSPHPLPGPVVLPEVQLMDSGEISYAGMASHMANAETVARSFAKLFVTLSVIGPKHFPRLRAVFEAGNSDHQEDEGNVENFRYYVLFSKNFHEAYAALSHFCGGSRSPMEVDTCHPNSPNANVTIDVAQPTIWREYNNDGDIFMMLSRRLNELSLFQQHSATEETPIAAMEEEYDGIRSNQPRAASEECSSVPESSCDRIPEASTSVDVNRTLKRKYSEAFDEPNFQDKVGYAKPMMVKSQRVQDQIQLIEQSAESSFGYVKGWERELSSNEGGKVTFVSRLVAYMKDSAADTITSQWPQTLHIERLVSQSHLNNSPHEVLLDNLIFEAKDHSGIFDQMEMNSLCAYIKLPQQTLILSPSSEKSRLTGVLYNGILPLSMDQGSYTGSHSRVVELP